MVCLRVLRNGEIVPPDVCTICTTYEQAIPLHWNRSQYVRAELIQRPVNNTELFIIHHFIYATVFYSQRIYEYFLDGIILARIQHLHFWRIITNTSHFNIIRAFSLKYLQSFLLVYQRNTKKWVEIKIESHYQLIQFTNQQNMYILVQ